MFLLFEFPVACFLFSLFIFVFILIDWASAKFYLSNRYTSLFYPCSHEIYEEIWFVELNLSWCCILLIWCDVVQSLEFDHLILSRLDAYAWFRGSGARDILEVCWTSTLDLGKRSTRCFSSWLNAYAWFEEAEHVMFLKLESWKKVCIFKGASIFDDGRLQELGSLLSLWRILSRSSRVKIFHSLQMRKFFSGLCRLETGWFMDQTHRLNHIDLSYI